MSPALALDGASQTMSSREIAELTGKEHDNVRRDVRNMASALSLSLEEKVEPSTGGRPSKVFLLSKRESLILVSGYDIRLRARIIDRWEELERAEAAPSPPAINVRDDAQFAEIGLQLHAYNAELRARVAVLEPKAEAFENLADPVHGASKPSDTAKSLGVPEQQFFRDLVAMGWLYKGGENYVGYAAKEKAGLLEHRPSTWTDRFHRSHFRLQVWITPKGRQQLSLHYTTRGGTLLERRSPAALPAPTGDLLQ